METPLYQGIQQFANDVRRTLSYVSGRDEGYTLLLALEDIRWLLSYVNSSDFMQVADLSHFKVLLLDRADRQIDESARDLNELMCVYVTQLIALEN